MLKKVNVNLMVSGMSGLGKTTCICNMLATFGNLERHDGTSTNLELFQQNPDALVMRTSPQAHPDKACSVTYWIQDTPG